MNSIYDSIIFIYLLQDRHKFLVNIDVFEYFIYWCNFSEWKKM